MSDYYPSDYSIGELGVILFIISYFIGLFSNDFPSEKKDDNRSGENDYNSSNVQILPNNANDNIDCGSCNLISSDCNY
jgi:hypothetical protein